MTCRVSLDWTYHGMRTLVLENNRLRIVYLLDKGGDMIELTYKPLDIDLLFHAPTGYRRPNSYVESCRRSEGEFMEYYGGGWQDILPFAMNTLETLNHRYGEWGLHGETPLLPWHAYIEKNTSLEATARLSVDLIRYPFHLDKWITIKDDSNTISVRERLVNMSAQTLEYCWLQHPALGRPLVEPGTRIAIPAEHVVVDKPEPLGRLRGPETYEWPHAEDRSGKLLDISIVPDDSVSVDETIFLTDLREPWYAVMNPRLDLGFALRWDLTVYPYVWFWQSYWARDHPWFGRGYCIALEPSSGFPGASEQLRRGTIKKLSGESSIESELRATIFTEIKNVKGVAEDGEVLSA